MIRRLTAADIHKGDLQGKNGACCLVGHLGGLGSPKLVVKMHEALRKELDSRGLFFHFKTVNDHIYTKEEVAALWNIAADQVEEVELVFTLVGENGATA